MNIVNKPFLDPDNKKTSAYNEYLRTHIASVKHCLTYLQNNGIIPFGYLENYVREHDESKWGSCEFVPYREYFYGKRDSHVDEEFKKAWLHHIHNNPHHWQYWVLINDDDGIEIIEMPKRYVIEMICDWMSFGYSKHDLTMTKKWYEERKDKIMLHPETRKIVEEILEKLTKVAEQDPYFNGSIK